MSNTNIVNNINFVTLETFLSLVHDVATETIISYNQQVSYPSVLSTSAENIDEETVYVRQATRVQELTKANVLNTILDRIPFSAPKGITLEEKIEELIAESVNNFGTPTHVVKLTDQVYALLCAEDFSFKTLSPLQGALLCYAPRRSFLFQAEGVADTLFQ